MSLYITNAIGQFCFVAEAPFCMAVETIGRRKAAVTIVVVAAGVIIERMAVTISSTDACLRV